jgi:ribonuclease-3
MGEEERVAALATAQQVLGVTFRKPQLLEQALTHRSLLKEAQQNRESNERLEFLGDRVLGQVVAEHLFRQHPDWSEGQLTKIKAVAVSEATLGTAARELGLGDLIRMARGEQQSGGRDRSSILSDSLEAVIGAIFLDRGLRAARLFVLGALSRQLTRIEEQQQGKDYKTVLQELTQERHKTTPHYRVIEERGPDHEKTFVVQVRVRSRLLGTGVGRSKKEAEQAAAREALEKEDPSA